MTQVCLHKPNIHKKIKTFSGRFYVGRIRVRGRFSQSIWFKLLTVKELYIDKSQ